ncbi:kelch-like protein 18 [Daphnia pulicaria]|uniref:kelch-like protein 18 n=1 Tax=Daphnia pulicaria TaxID=35523 RepID=UPI001EEB404B|nr:kelch-like protein 18 [Daphnia pulicaria]
MAESCTMSGGCVMFQQADLASSAFPVFEEIRKQGKLCDVTIKVDDKLFSAHRIVLCATIPYFNSMFTIDMVESRQREVEVRGIDPSAMESLIQFAYSGKITIHPGNVNNLMIGAAYLQLNQVRDACADFYKQRLDCKNVLSIQSFAETLSCTDLVKAADRFLEKNFTQVAEEEEFVSIDVSQMQELLNRDSLCVTEEGAFEALIRWVKKDSELRSKHLPNLLAQVRLPLLSPTFLTDRVSKEELIRSCHRCRDLVDEAKDFHLLPERRSMFKSYRCRPRCFADVSGLLYAVGGLTKAGDSLSTVEVMDPVTGRWNPAEAMSIRRSRVGVAILRNNLYAIGGYNGVDRLQTVEVLDGPKRIWRGIGSMNCKRSAAGAASLHDYLYVCGGYDGVTSLNTVESYDPSTDCWKCVSAMNKHRSAAGVVAFDNHIYVLGGHDGLSIFDSVEKYNPQTGRWTPGVSMLSKRCRLGVAVLEGKLYACGGYDGSTFLRSVEVFDPKTEKWNHVAPMSVTRSRVALAANAGRLWAVGGYDGTANLNTVEVYDPKIDKWSFGSSMCAHEGGVGLGVVPL